MTTDDDSTCVDWLTVALAVSDNYWKLNQSISTAHNGHFSSSVSFTLLPCVRQNIYITLETDQYLEMRTRKVLFSFRCTMYAIEMAFSFHSTELYIIIIKSGTNTHFKWILWIFRSSVHTLTRDGHSQPLCSNSLQWKRTLRESQQTQNKIGFSRKMWWNLFICGIVTDVNDCTE